jgi:hypothetical protein
MAVGASLWLWRRGSACPVCNAAGMATMPEMPDGFHADAINKHFVDDQ